MKTMDEINRAWADFEEGAYNSIRQVILFHVRRDTLPSVVQQMDPSLLERFEGYARRQDYNDLIEQCRAEGLDEEPWVALREWVAGGCSGARAADSRPGA